MRKVYQKISFHLLLLLLIVACSLLTGSQIFAQGGRIELEIKVDKITAIKDSETGLRGTNDYRFDFWINDKDSELEFEMNDVGDNDIPKSLEFSDNNILSKFIYYGNEFKISMEAWEEDCGDDNTYNSCDDIYCKKEYTVSYEGTEPGVWHRALDNGNPFSCPQEYSAIVYYKWSAPTPPDPAIPSREICKGEEAVQFEVPDHPQKQHVVKWEWQKVIVYKVQTYPTTTDCAEQCASNDDFSTCYQTCMSQTPVYEDMTNVLDNFEGKNGSKLSYKNFGNGDQIRYRQIFSEDTSAWSKAVTETKNFYKVVQAIRLDTYVSGEEIETNHFCGGQAVALEAVAPAHESWQNHRFFWYRKTGDGDFKLIKDTGTNTYEDIEARDYLEQKIQYAVITKRVECDLTISDTTKSATLFFYEAVPDLSEHILPVNVSCDNATDGKIVIKANNSDPDKFYYYNIAKEDTNGTNSIDRTSILSSKKWPANKDFIFPDNVEGLPESYGGLGRGRYVIQIINGGHTYETDSTFKNEGYCFASFYDTIKIEPALEITKFSPIKELSCHRGSDGQIELNFRNGKGPFQLELFKGNTEDFTIAQGMLIRDTVNTDTVYAFQGLSSGFYKARITQANTICYTETDIIQLDEPIDLTLAVELMKQYNGQIISCFDAKDGKIMINPEGGNKNQAYIATLMLGDSLIEVKTFHDTTSFKGLGAGDNYLVKVKDNCCSCNKEVSTTFTLEQPAPLTIDIVSIKPITCYGAPHGSVTVFSSGGTKERRFKIDGKAWQAWVKEQEAFTFYNLDSGWHTVEVQDVNTCTSSNPFSFYLEYPSPLTFTVDTLIMPRCYGGSDGKIIIKPEGGAHESHVVTESYKVTLSSPKVDTAIVVQRGEKAVFNQLPSDNYQVIIEDADPRHACTASPADVFLPEPTPVEIQVTDIIMPSCFGAENGVIKIKASGGTPGPDPYYYYSIDGNHYVAPDEEGVAVFSGLKASEYIFYAIDGHHEDYETPAFLNSDSNNKLCAARLNFTLKEPELITIYTTVESVVCYRTPSGAIIVDSISGGQGEYTYQWEMYDTTRKIYAALSPVQPLHLEQLFEGSYKLTVFDTAGCRGTTTLDITQPHKALSIDTLKLYEVSCQGTSDGKIRIFASGGYPPYTYQLDQGLFQPYGFFEGLSEVTYTLTVRDYLGCEISQKVLLPTEILKVEVVENIPATKGKNDGLFQLNVTGGKNKRYYLDGIINSTGVEYNELAPGKHTMTVYYNNGCVWESTFFTEEVDALVPELRVSTKSLQPISCNDMQNGSAMVQASGGVAPYSFQWNDENAQTGSEAKHLAKGSYTVTVTDAEGSVKKHEVTIDGPEVFEVVHASAVSPTCYQGADGQASVTVVGGTPPYNFYWDDPQQQTTATATQLSAGTYTVTVKDKNGCELSQMVTVKEALAPEDIIGAEEITLCTGQSIQVDAISEWSSYQWTSDNGFTSDESTVTLEKAGAYFLKVTSEQGCEVLDTLRLITSDNMVEAQFLLPTEIIAGDTVVLTEVSWPVPEHKIWSYSGQVIKYKSEEEKEYVVFPAPGEYTVELEVFVGNCTDILKKKIIVGSVDAEKAAENGRLGLTKTQEFFLYPNPNGGKFTIKVCLNQPQDIQINIYDPLFKYHYHTQQFSDTDRLEEQIDLSSLKSSTYVLLIRTPVEIKVLRFIIN